MPSRKRNRSLNDDTRKKRFDCKSVAVDVDDSTHVGGGNGERCVDKAVCTTCVTIASEITCLREQVTTLRQQVDFLLSFVGITSASTTATSSGSATLTTNSTSTSASQSTCTVTTAPQEHNAVTPTLPSSTAIFAAVDGGNTLKQSVLSAVFTELHDRQDRERNIIVSGLQPSLSETDTQLVSKLVSEEMHLAPTIVRCKRIGKLPTANQPKPQLLLVVLSSSEEARSVVSRAYRLRQSGDSYVRSHVYINAHLTRAESEAAYIARCRRRQQRLRPAAAAGRLNADAPDFMSAAAASVTPCVSLMSHSSVAALPVPVPANTGQSDQLGSSC